MRFAIVEARINRMNRGAAAEFSKLAGVSAQRKLKPNEAKRFARLQTQLMRSGVIVPLTKQVVRDHARALYASLPWWRKLGLRVRFYLARAIAAVKLRRLKP